MTYPASLDALWAAHVAPRAPDAPSCVSLFAGCGGSSLGYSSAGFAEVLAAEWDARAVEVFRRNFGGVPIWQGDITRLDPGVLDLPAGALDLLDASPPCQAYSMTGLRRPGDPRGQLWRQVTRLAGSWQPRVIVLENVAGLAAGKMRPVFRDVCAALRDAGYAVQARLVDSSLLGVPQKRARILSSAYDPIWAWSRCSRRRAPGRSRCAKPGLDSMVPASFWCRFPKARHWRR